jgi:hypothetical protein
MEAIPSAVPHKGRDLRGLLKDGKAMLIDMERGYKTM